MQTNVITQDTTIAPKRKSVDLTEEEIKSLKKFVKAFKTTTEAAEAIGVSRQVLDRVLLVGSGSQDKISIIRDKISSAA